MFLKLVKKIESLLRLYLLRDPFQISVKEWFLDNGDTTLRLNYPLDKSSIVFDVGGYLGDYAEAIHQKYGCHVYLFEPVPSFYKESVKRFANNPKIVCLNYGLSASSGWFDISVDNNASSFKRIERREETQLAQIRSFTEVIAELSLNNIDLIKINIEGGEFDLLPAIIDSGFIKKTKFLQIQFHNFIEDAAESRRHIRNLLGKTHKEMWNYEFVWESWELF